MRGGEQDELDRAFGETSSSRTSAWLLRQAQRDEEIGAPLAAMTLRALAEVREPDKSDE